VEPGRERIAKHPRVDALCGQRDAKAKRAFTLWMTRKIHDPAEADDRFRTVGDSVTKGLDSLLSDRPTFIRWYPFVLSVVGGNTKRKVVVADTPPQEALSHNKTTWIVHLHLYIRTLASQFPFL
jgi:hypothetical protein